MMIKIQHLNKILWVVLSFTFLTTNNAQNVSENIRLNQIGFYPNAAKEAVWVGEQKTAFFILSENKKDTVFRGKLSPQRINPISQKTSQIADFSALKKEGKYLVFMPEVGYSYPFTIQKQAHRAAAIAALKGYYFQRIVGKTRRSLQTPRRSSRR
jgi:endoglucanase